MNAIVFVDVQKDFIDGTLGNEWAQNTVPRIVDYAKLCASKGCKLYATRDTHDSRYPFTLEGENLPIGHCVEGTSGWMIDERLQAVIDGKVTIVNKPTFGSYDLVEILQEDSKKDPLESITLCGFCTSICVLANAVLLRAKFPNVKIRVYADLCADVTLAKHTAALSVLEAQQIIAK